VWDLRTKSSLLWSCGVDGRSITLRPFRTVSAHLLPVTSVAFCQQVSFMLVSCSLDRSLNLFSASVIQSVKTHLGYIAPCVVLPRDVGAQLLMLLF